MGTSSEPDFGGVVLSTRKALALIVVGTFLPCLAIYMRSIPDYYTRTIIFVYAPFWTLTAYGYDSIWTGFEVGSNPLQLPPVGATWPIWNLYYFAAWLSFVIGLGILHRRPAQRGMLKAAIMLNSASALFMGLVLVGQVSRYGTSELVYPFPIPMIPLIGLYALRGWRISPPPIVRGEIDCPFCRSRFTTGPEGVHIGRTVKCPTCGKVLKVTG